MPISTQHLEPLSGAVLAHHQLMEAIDIIDALEAENTLLRQKLAAAVDQQSA